MALTNLCLKLGIIHFLFKALHFLPAQLAPESRGAQQHELLEPSVALISLLGLALSFLERALLESQSLI